MRKTFGRTLAIALGAGMFAAGPALAVTVANKTDKAVEVTADLGAEEPKTNIDAGKSAQLNCPEGCEIRAVGLNSYGIYAKSGDSLMIKDGMLVHADSQAASNDKGKSK